MVPFGLWSVWKSKRCGPARVLMWDVRKGVLPVEAMLVKLDLRGMTGVLSDLGRFLCFGLLGKSV